MIRRIPCLMVIGLLLASAWPSGGSIAQEEATLGAAATPEAVAPSVETPRAGAENVVQPSIGEFPGPNSIRLLKVADGLRSPRVIVSAHDGTGRLFIGEQAGTIRILTKEGELLPEPFLDMTYLVASNHQEQGILGIAFHPDYESNGLFYVSYTDIFVNGTVVVAQFQVSADDPNRASTENIRDILKTPHPTPDLNAGTIHFGPDGYLYIAIGNAGFYGIHDVFSAQVFDTHLGKILRLQVGFAEGPTYETPPDNPYNVSYQYWHAQHVWMIGLRNPWQFAFDPETGDMYVPDVGETSWEEINFVPAGSTGGQNFGWPMWEGTHCYNFATSGACPDMGTLPVAQYAHGEDGCAVVGLAVYRGAMSVLDGAFLAGDFCSGKIWGLSRNTVGQWIFQELLDTTLMLVGGGNDDEGEVYILSCECGSGAWSTVEEPGTVWKVIAPSAAPEGAELAAFE